MPMLNCKPLEELRAQIRTLQWSQLGPRSILRQPQYDLLVVEPLMTTLGIEVASFLLKSC